MIPLSEITNAPLLFEKLVYNESKNMILTHLPEYAIDLRPLRLADLKNQQEARELIRE